MARKASNNPSKNYFTQETEDYIIKYNNSSDPEEKNKIFRDYLYYPFYKLAENIIHTYKFYNTDIDDIEDLKLDIITMLCQEKIQGFDPSRGCKAFSYFGTIVKRWLMAYSNTNYRKKVRQSSLDSYENVEIEDPKDVEVAKTVSLSDFIDNWVKETYDNLNEMFPEKEDRIIADAVLTIFRTRQNLEVLNKKFIYNSVREITNCNTPCLTKAVTKLKEDFYKKYNDFLKIGKIVVE